MSQQKYIDFVKEIKSRFPKKMYRGWDLVKPTTFTIDVFRLKDDGELTQFLRTETTIPNVIEFMQKYGERLDIGVRPYYFHSVNPNAGLIGLIATNIPDKDIELCTHFSDVLGYHYHKANKDKALEELCQGFDISLSKTDLYPSIIRVPLLEEASEITNDFTHRSIVSDMNRVSFVLNNNLKKVVDQYIGDEASFDITINGYVSREVYDYRMMSEHVNRDKMDEFINEKGISSEFFYSGKLNTPIKMDDVIDEPIGYKRMIGYSVLIYTKKALRNFKQHKAMIDSIVRNILTDGQFTDK